MFSLKSIHIFYVMPPPLPQDAVQKARQVAWDQQLCSGAMSCHGNAYSLVNRIFLMIITALGNKESELANWYDEYIMEPVRCLYLTRTWRLSPKKRKQTILQCHNIWLSSLLPARMKSVIEPFRVVTLFGIFLMTDNRQNFMRLIKWTTAESRKKSFLRSNSWERLLMSLSILPICH